MQNSNGVRNADLDMILATMAAMAHEIDHNMTHAQQIKVMEAFGALIVVVLAGSSAQAVRNTP